MPQDDPLRAPLAAGLGTATLALLGWWAWASDQGLVGNLRVLERGPGAEVVLSLMPVSAIDGPDRFVVANPSLTVAVHGPTAGLSVGQEVSVGGVLRDGFVEARWTEVAHGRAAKKRLGLLGLALAGLVAAATVRFERSGLALRG